MEKPGPAPGSSPRAVADPEQRGHGDQGGGGHAAPSDSAERVIAAYECALGAQGDWELRLCRGADGDWNATMAEEKAGEFYGHGRSVTEAYASLLRLLGEELDRRREDLTWEVQRLDALRAELREGAS
jgi:hypothetical protein